MIGCVPDKRTPVKLIMKIYHLPGPVWSPPPPIFLVYIFRVRERINKEVNVFGNNELGFNGFIKGDIIL